MLFNSHIFLFAFLPLTWIACWLVQRHATAAELVLLVASLVFYAWGAPWLLALIGGSILFNYGVGRALAALRGRPRRALLIAGILANVILLAYFKYANFLIDNVNALLAGQVGAIDVALPLGISFFTFQQIGYLADAASTSTSEPSLRRYALFVAYFPQLVAGPIIHHRDFLPQVAARVYQRVRSADGVVGLTFIAIGLTKKVLFADTIAPVADAVFGISGGRITSADAWLGTLAFSLQIYFDFSGYCDIAVGLARLSGFRIAVNFLSPYQATSIIEFWRRWHITLSDFLRTYLYIPLGGNRLGFLRQLGNVMIVMLIGGLWHGASWTFVAWGGLHGALLALNHLWRRRPPVRAIPPAVGRAATFLAVIFLWVVFRAQTFSVALIVWRALVDVPTAARELLVKGLAAAAPLSSRSVAASWAPYLPGVIAALLLLVWLAPNAWQVGEWLERRLEAPYDRPWTLGAVAACTGILLALAVLSVSEPREFLYFRF